MPKETLKFIDLFAGIGAFRLGFEEACTENGINAECVFTSEIKEHAKTVYEENFPGTVIQGDITQISADSIPNFDVLLAGFPCQAFSSAGKRQGFLDTRGTLFFDIERIVEHHKPKLVLLENVEGLVNHDKVDKGKPVGRTLETIITSLERLGYKVSWKVLSATDFGLPQARKRIYIVASKQVKVSLDTSKRLNPQLSEILQSGLPCEDNPTVRLLLRHYNLEELHGKSLKDKRGGKDNIHSWDIELKGKTSTAERSLLNSMLTARRSKRFAESKGIAWMDGMPLTVAEIQTIGEFPNLDKMLAKLTGQGYLTYEHPKDLVAVQQGETQVFVRKPRLDLEKGYNIVVGKLSFEINKILDPKGVSPTLVATDLARLYVVDKDGLRKLSLIEKLRLFGIPDSFKMNVPSLAQDDLLGNTVAVHAIKFVANQALQNIPKVISSKVSDQLLFDTAV